MKAENVIPILNALPENEVERLYRMLGVVPANVEGPPKPSKGQKLLSDGEATEIVLAAIKKNN